VLAWLAELRRWARAVAACLKPSGFLFLYEFHPVLGLFDGARSPTNVVAHGSYFHHAERVTVRGTYADWSAPVRFPSQQWQSSLEDVLDAVLRAGLRIERFREYETIRYPHLRVLRKGRGSYWGMPPGGPRIPLMFALKASKG
jgi:hypothetical protein